MLHYTADELKPADIDFDASMEEVFIDYWKGRMVKLSLKRVANTEDTWKVHDEDPSSDYQSWCVKYPTYRALIEAAGAKVLP